MGGICRDKHRSELSVKKLLCSQAGDANGKKNAAYSGKISHLSRFWFLSKIGKPDRNVLFAIVQVGTNWHKAGARLIKR
jgi:hypothetical protein